MIPLFDDITLRNLADILAGILTHTKISETLASLNIEEAGGTNKTDRIFNALKTRQKRDACGNNVVALILYVINPKRYNSEDEFERDRCDLNEKLLYEGIEIDKRGQIRYVNKAKTISEAKERSLKIKEKTHGINERNLPSDGRGAAALSGEKPQQLSRYCQYNEYAGSSRL